MGIGAAIVFAIDSLFNIVYTLIVIRVFSSWLPFLYSNPTISKILYMIESLTEPVMAPVRKLLSKTQLGQMPLDFSPIIVLLLLQFAQTVVRMLLISLL